MRPLISSHATPMLSRLPILLAWRNLTESKRRLATSVAGTAFAVVLMYMENGFRNALLDGTVAVIRRIDGQLVMINPQRYVFTEPMRMPRRRLDQVRGYAGVISACPLYVEAWRTLWRNPDTRLSRRIRVLAYHPDDNLLKLDEVRRQQMVWSRSDTVLADRLSKEPEYGPFREGLTSELSGHRVRVVGTFTLGTDFQNNGNLIMSEANFLRVLPQRLGASWGDTAIDIGVLRLADGADVDRIKTALQAALPADVLVLTIPELIAKEQAFWQKVTPVGVVFDIGMVMGFIVGTAICYQVLFSEISDRLAEFATLKAMGYSNQWLLRVVVCEALFLAILGYGVGLALTLPAFGLIHDSTGLPMMLKPWDAALIFGLTLVMCTFSGLLAARKLVVVDPAELYA
jgi:putative ABC transport system permease protein